MTDPSSLKLPSRGTIIVDAAALFSLGGKVQPQFKADGIKPDRYLDILTFLANEGYRIVIPEIVAIEAAEILSSGKDIADLFPRQQNKFAKSAPILKPFLKHVASYQPSANNNGRMEILTHTGPEDINNYCKALQDALNNRVNSHRLRNGSYYQPRSANQLLIQAAHTTNTSQFGDKAICALVADRSQFPVSEPITVLSNDIGLLTRVREISQEVSTCTSAHLICGCALSGLSPFIGLNPEVPLADLRNDMVSGNIGVSTSTIKPLTPHIISRYQSGPFYQSLQHLAADMTYQQTSTSALEDEKPGPRAEKFATKFSKIQKIHRIFRPYGKCTNAMHRYG